MNIEHLHALRVELKLQRKLKENRLLQPTGDAMATGEVIVTEELMATGKLSYTVFRQCVTAGSSLRRIAALLPGLLASSSLVLF